MCQENKSKTASYIRKIATSVLAAKPANTGNVFRLASSIGDTPHIAAPTASTPHGTQQAPTQTDAICPKAATIATFKLPTPARDPASDPVSGKPAKAEPSSATRLPAPAS